MSDYVFTFPSGTPPMTYEGLSAYLSHQDVREIGTTVRIYRWLRSGITVRLYDAYIARIYPDRVLFKDDDPHVTTTYWIERIVQDNGLGTSAGRIRRRKADGPGPVTPRGSQAGLLCIDFDRDKPVFGRAWPVTRTTHQEVTAS